MRKLYALSVPLLAVAAFAIVPSVASAATTYGTCAVGTPHSTNCPSGTTEHFTPFAEGEKVAVLTKKPAGSPNFLLKAAGGGVIECTSLEDYGWVANIGGFGTSHETLEFDGCFALSGTLKCPVETAPAGSGNIVAVVTNKVITATEVTIKVVAGVVITFTGPPPTGCPAAGTPVGNVAGEVTGTETAGTNVLKFVKKAGLKLNGEETELSGEDELTNFVGGKIFI